MRSEVNAISGRLSLRPPQRQALEILDRVVEIVPPRKGTDTDRALEIIQSEFPHVTDFERDFPSLCFSLATGVGKTRLMGAFISYLHTAHGIDNFFVLAPNLTIYNKLITDFTEGSPKYVFKGIGAFATTPPDIITGDTYESYAGRLFDALIKCRVNIFNISKINSEVRGGRAPRIKRLSEYIGESYFSWLSQLPDLVLLMDESHRYRATAGVAAINELDPVLGLELTATPFVTQGSKTHPFKNVIQDYPLRRAMEDGFVKEPTVVTRRNFDPTAMSHTELERMKLEDGIRLHEDTKVQLETYAREQGTEIVKPFLLAIARDTTHAAELQALIRSEAFFEGRYAGKVIQVDSSGGGVEKDETIERLLRVERRDEPTEIVIHVNMLKEGWDVTNLYTIVPLRAASARVLIEQTIGRGLRLPYGKRTGVPAVDRLSIVAHDRFQEIVDEANRPDSSIQMKTLVLNPDDLALTPKTVIAQSVVDAMFGEPPAHVTDSTIVATGDTTPVFETTEERRIAWNVLKEIGRLQRNPEFVPNVEALDRSEVIQHLVREVEANYTTLQPALDGLGSKVDTAEIARTVISVYIDKTISIPRIVVLPVDRDGRSGFHPFGLDLTALNYPPVSEDLWVQQLRTGAGETIGLATSSRLESQLEDYVVSGLIDFDDVSYDDNAGLLYDLAGQTVRHFVALLGEEETERILRVNQRAIARFVHSQMTPQFWENSSGEFETEVLSGFTEMKSAAFSSTGEQHNFRVAPTDKSNMSKYVFGGFERCLNTVQQFHSDTERVLAVILDRESLKWCKPAKGLFQITYPSGSDWRDYIPDFVAELDDRKVMLEPKASNQMQDPDVIAKRDAAVEWCRLATGYSISVGDKPWSYALIPHTEIAENQSIEYLLQRWTVK